MAVQILGTELALRGVFSFTTGNNPLHINFVLITVNVMRYYINHFKCAHAQISNSSRVIRGLGEIARMVCRRDFKIQTQTTSDHVFDY